MRFARPIISILLFLLLGAIGSAAQQQFNLNGVIFEGGTKIRIALAEITNLRNGYSVGSNDMGIFQIKSLVGDTLIISKRGFNSRTVVVTTTADLIVNLNRNTLDEVVVFGQSKKKQLDDIKADYRAKGTFYNGKPPFLAFIFKPLTALYETFGRTPRNARRFGRFYNTELEQSHVDQYFNRSSITQHTGLQGQALDNFMINYRPDYEKTKTWNAYDGMKYIMDSYKKYSDTAGKK